MAKKELARFFAEHLASHPDVRAKLNAVTDDASMARMLAETGQKAGFDFHEQDVLDVLNAPVKQKSGALSDAALEGIAGGKGDRVKYMEIKLKEVFITGV